MAEAKANTGSESRTCRYGHGPLKDSGRLWALQGVEPGDPAAAGGRPWLNHTNHVFSTELFFCPRCGYVEMFDPASIES